MSKKNLEIFLKFTVVTICFFVFWLMVTLQPTPLTKFLCLGAALFCIGLYGILTSRTVLKTLICMEILFNAANLNLVAFSHFTDVTFVRGQIFALFVMAIAAAEAALGLAIIISVYRLKQTSELTNLTELKG